ncbi:two pore domain potassium channel family protein [Arthrobacter echini]|uniref:Two pore domain potassium channel family protein n=1 Tax=Arthrobacter echini TaxID=1529066 RepID=A0A5D0XX43_9MICC|nr:potassium channel family protein [Arthrobacter echini]TYD00602.1 two pore domain potassium channel family protein [Arthrobacter echini]
MSQASWEARAEWPLAGAAILFLVVYSMQVIGQPNGTWAVILLTVIWIIWVVFLVDYAVRLYLAEHRRRWFIRNIHELLIVALPMLRPLRLLRLITLLRTLHKVGGHALRGRLVTYVIGSVAILSYVAALTVLDIERMEPGANITSMGDALWWAMATITTVGYGDFYPVTIVGRLIATALMIGGIAVLGVVTATLASWLVESVAAETTAEVESGDQALQNELAEVKEQLRLLLESNRTTTSEKTPS